LTANAKRVVAERTEVLIDQPNCQRSITARDAPYTDSSSRLVSAPQLTRDFTQPQSSQPYPASLVLSPDTPNASGEPNPFHGVILPAEEVDMMPLFSGRSIPFGQCLFSYVFSDFVASRTGERRQRSGRKAPTLKG
jgi:hypothetical protein